MTDSIERPKQDATMKSEDARQLFQGKANEVFSVALADAVTRDNQSLKSRGMLKLYCCIAVVTLTSCMNGYDGSVMSSLNAMDPFHAYFGIAMDGSVIGLVTALYAVGQMIGCLFANPASDLLGRRFGMSAGCTVIIVGTIIQATTKNIGGFMGGRVLLGLGVTLVTTSAPVYIIEIAYPTWRGIGGGLFNVNAWYIGALTASWTTYGIGVWFLPESPRWLIMRQRDEQAKRILVDYHGDGREDSAVVQLEIEEIHASIAYARGLAVGQKWWDFRILWSSRQVVYRMWLVLLVTFFSQFIGGSISYFMPVVYEHLGLTSSKKQLLLTALSTVVSYVSGLVGCATVDSFGRRNLFLWGTFLTGCVYLVMNVLASMADGNISPAKGYTFIVMTFLYGVFWSFCWTPLQALYPSEILRNDIRVKGMAAQGFLAGGANFVNMYATPVALANIGWITLTIFLIIHFIELVAMYLTVVETKGRSLEELEEIFTARNPVKASLEKRKVVVERGVGVLSKDESL